MNPVGGVQSVAGELREGGNSARPQPRIGNSHIFLKFGFRPTIQCERSCELRERCI